MMNLHQPLDVLIAHDSWATDQLIDSLRRLSDAQLDQPFEMGMGSLRATIIHTIDVIGGWHASLAGTNDYEPIDPKASVETIAAKHAVVAEAFGIFCKEGTAIDVLHATRGTRSITVPRGVVATHVLTHGTHHRAQALNMLRHLGVQPLPQSGAMQWAVATGSAELVTTDGKN